jgi:4-phytase/acid phosphatase/peptide/nickel transport system substrate-binding protein
MIAIDRTEGHWLLRLAVAAALVVAFALQLTPPEARAAGKTLTVGIEVDPTGFDAIKGRVLGEAPASVAVTIMDRLMERGPDGNLVGTLAVSWSESADGKSYVYKLRRGVTFHDGTPFNADAVVAHFTRILDPANKYVGLMFIQPVQSVEKVDDYTVRVNLAHRWLPAREVFSVFALCCFIPSPKAVAADIQNRAPVGTGPYMFKEWKGGDRIVVVRNPNYWDKSAKVTFDEIVFRILPDQQTRFAALQSGEIDATWTDRGLSIVQARQDPNLTVHSLEGGGGSIIFLNATKPPLDDVRVRRTLSHAWDQKYYVEKLLLGTQGITTHGLGPGVKCDAGYLSGGDVEDAKKLLAEVGKPVTVELLHTSTQRGREFGLLYQQLGKRAGITMTLKPMDQLSFVQAVFANNYQIAGWRIADTGDIGPQLFGLLHSKSPYNLAHYSDAEMDKLLVAMYRATTDQERIDATCAVVRKMNADAPILWQTGRIHNAITKKSLRGLRPLFQGVLDARFTWFEE